MIYILDSTAISDYLRNHAHVRNRIQAMLINQQHTLTLVAPVHYELYRGLQKRNATAQLKKLDEEIVKILAWLPLMDVDWIKAAEFWVETQRKGRQLSEIDLLIAAITYRANGILVSSDADFDALPIKREDWRI